MPRAGTEPGQQVEARRDLTEAGEMMLDQEGAVIAERLGFDIVFDEVAEALAAVGVGAAAPGLRTAEKSKSHWFDLLGPGSRVAVTSRTRARRDARLPPSWPASPTQWSGRPQPGRPRSRSRNRCPR